LKNFQLYVIIDKKASRKDPLTTAKQAIRGGADIIQYRDKEATVREMIFWGQKLRRFTCSRKVIFIVNDRTDVALAVDADGVHLGQDDLPVDIARKILRNKLVGISTHSLAQAIKAEKDGADYIGVGPVYSTPTKPDYPAVGLKLIKEVSRRVKIPFVAIGGIDSRNIDGVLMAGARRVAVVRAVVGAGDITSAARELKRKLEEADVIASPE
jgi:thiamine-phosphate pyrophosphorylase